MIIHFEHCPLRFLFSSDASGALEISRELIHDIQHLNRMPELKSLVSTQSK